MIRHWLAAGTAAIGPGILPGLEADRGDNLMIIRAERSRFGHWRNRFENTYG